MPSDTVSDQRVGSARGLDHPQEQGYASRSERRPAIEAKLLEATERLLSDGTPYTELSIQQLCSEAGIARSTFYVYFRDKSDLVARLAEEMVGQLSAVASKWWQPGSGRNEVLPATRELIEIYVRHGALFAALTETAAYDAEMRALQAEMVERHARPLEELIEHGKPRGTVREVHAHETVAALSWMLQGSCYHLVRDDGHGDAGPARRGVDGDHLARALPRSAGGRAMTCGCRPSSRIPARDRPSPGRWRWSPTSARPAPRCGGCRCRAARTSSA